MAAKRTGCLVFALAGVAAAGSSCAEGPARSDSGLPPAVVAGQAFPPQRCDDNRAVGKIVYLSGFDFAAAASVVDVLVADRKGYFEALCLDVEIRSSFSADNYALVANADAQFASAGSFSELVAYQVGADTGSPGSGGGASTLVALAVEGRLAIDTLIVKLGGATTLSDLEGATIGVKGRMTPAVQAMLAKNGLVEGVNFTTEAVQGFDPLDHIALPSIDGFLGYRSNEPGVLDRAGVQYTHFDPSDFGVPGSFGVIYASRDFIGAHPAAAQDFMRAAMRGLVDSIADPAAASMTAVDFIENNGNPSGLSIDGEVFRWQTESVIVAESGGAGKPMAIPDQNLLEAEVAAYADNGLYGGQTPNIDQWYDATVLTEISDSAGMIIWPSDT